jgi:Domain of unknown function (DUF4123)
LLKKETEMTMDSLSLQLQQKQAQAGGVLHLYALADSAQDARIPAQLNKFVTTPLRTRCLLEGGDRQVLDPAAPHLVALTAFDGGADLWRALLHNAPKKPSSVSIIASPLAFDALYAHLAAWTQVTLPDDEEMIFAYWDSAIFATLIGQKDDKTLHVAGPVLTQGQATALMAPIAALWYWDRAGQIHLAQAQTEQQTEQQAKQADAEPENTQAPIKLAQVQVDMLVEASVPDHLLAHLKETQPALMSKMEAKQHYAFVRKSYVEAQSLNLNTMQDYVRYICLALMYGEQFKSDPAITNLLGKVKLKNLKLETAVAQFPAIEASKKDGV